MTYFLAGFNSRFISQSSAFPKSVGNVFSALQGIFIKKTLFLVLPHHTLRHPSLLTVFNQFHYLVSQQELQRASKTFLDHSSALDVKMPNGNNLILIWYCDIGYTSLIYAFGSHSCYRGDFREVLSKWCSKHYRQLLSRRMTGAGGYEEFCW